MIKAHFLNETRTRCGVLPTPLIERPSLPALKPTRRRWHKLSRVAYVLVAATLAGCSLPAEPKTQASAGTTRFTRVEGTRFVEPNGKPIVFHGINVVEKSKAKGYVGDLTADDFRTIRSWGMNCVRLGIFWDGLEPEPGRIDEAYLERVANLVGWAKAAGLWVLLDMHQDLYSVKYSDGAPAWATLDEGKPHTKGAVWSDSYYVSDAVQTALDHFWSNSPGPDGTGLQDHYARVWRRVADRFKDEPAVVGFDLMNEPFPGKDGGRLMQALMAEVARNVAGTPGAPGTPEEFAAMQATPEGRRRIMQWLADLQLYQAMLEPGTPIMQEFDRIRLQPFYHKVTRAIREVNSHHIIFFEPAMSANLGIPTGLVPLKDVNGKRDPQQAYAPHGYDIVVDTSAIELMCNDRVALIFRRHGEFSSRHQLPMLVGEWGAYYLDSKATDAARFAVKQFDNLGCSDTYWDYQRDLGRSPLLDALRRHPPGETVFYVARNGHDEDPGTCARPFATLERAREAVRTADPGTVRKVILRGGVYEQRSTFRLQAPDSGSAERPVTWEAAPGEAVRLAGGIALPVSAWKPVNEGPLLARLDPAARGRVLQADLALLGVTNLAPFPVAYHGVPPGPELFFNGARSTLARWPNEGWATIARIVEPGSRPRDGDTRGLTGAFEYAGDRPARWQAKDGVWLQGYWCYDWYDEVIRVAAIDSATRRISLAAPHVYSVMQGNPSPRRYRALNVLEELDRPGEFVIDPRAGRLYLWPPADTRGAEILMATLDSPVVALEDVSHVILKGFVIEAGLDNGVEVKNGRQCAIVSCELRNLRRQGIRITGGDGHRMLFCDIHHTGQGGLVLGGGDRKTLTPAGHEAANNHIWRFSEHQLTSAYGLSFEGVGNRASHNLIHDAPHQAVFVGGNDHVFELNEVHRVCTETDDCGALYKGRNPSCRGNQIRFNYWHDVGSPMGHGNAAVYFDDGDGGDTVFGNVFVRCGEPGKGSFGTVFSHGGHDNRAANNVFVDCKRALGSAPWDDARWRDALAGGQDCFFVPKLQQEVDITRPPFTTRYPELVGYLNPPAGAKRVNHARLNLLVRCTEVAGGNWELEPATNWSTNNDPGFLDLARGNYRLRDDAEVFKKLSGFKPIPFEQMGLQRDRREQTGKTAP